jgi:hypothetical protein
MDEMLIRVMTRLVRVHDELGEEAFANASNRALVAIARSVQLDAEQKAGLEQPSFGASVLRFPTPATPARNGDGSAA